MFLGSKPIPEVELACGSASTSNVLNSSTAKLAARLMDDVVFPTPPFWLAKAIILLILCVKDVIKRFIRTKYSNWPCRFRNVCTALKIRIKLIQKSTALGYLQTTGQLPGYRIIDLLCTKPIFNSASITTINQQFSNSTITLWSPSFQQQTGPAAQLLSSRNIISDDCMRKDWTPAYFR